jgi:hypothetical protein
VEIERKTMKLKDDPNAPKPRFKRDEEYRKRLREEIPRDTYEENGALIWKASDNAVPLDCFRDAGLLPPKGQAAEIKRRDAIFLKKYREQMKDYKPSAEEIFEMNAAFGPGQTIVNVITGQVIHKTPEE